jgi:signal transduction histidine kinase
MMAERMARHQDSSHITGRAVDTLAVSETRKAILVGAMGMATYAVLLWLTSSTLGFSARGVVPLFGAAVGVNLILAASAPYWCGARWAGAVYGSAHALLMTGVLFLVGGLRMSILVFVYMFPIFHAGMLGPNLAVFVTANAAALSYCLMAVAEVTGLFLPPGLKRPDIAPIPATGLVVIAWVGLNFLALYAVRYGRQLRHYAADLERQVAHRTAELTELNAELDDKNRALETKQDELRTLVYAVTHDLKNPTNSILLTADLLQEREAAALSPQGREDLDRIVTLASTTEDMIRDLLGLFRITSAAEEPAWVDVDAQVASAIETLRPQIDAKGARVTADDLPRMWARPGQLSNVVQNLLSNAVKYVPAGGGRIEISGRIDGDATLLCVRDNGVGIPPRYHRGIFELFGRVPPEEQPVDGVGVAGSGVGLAIAKRIVEAHGGAIWVDSDAGRGSSFWVRLPVPAEVRAA